MEQEITERKQAELELARPHGLMRGLIDSIPDLIFYKDVDGVYLGCNQAFSELVGVPVQQVVGKTDFDLFPEELARSLQKQDREILSSKESLHSEEWVDYPNGRKALLGTLKTLFYASDGRILGLIGVSRDITERKLIEKEKEKLRKQLRQAQKMEAIGTLAGGIAHDFNNLLGVILGYSEMAMEEAGEQSLVRDNLHNVISAGLKAKDLVRQILSFSRQSEVERMVINPGLIVKEAIKLLRSSIPTTIEIKYDIQRECGMIEADPTQIHQVLMNLCTNSYHAMEKTGGTLTVELKREHLAEQDLVAEPHVVPGDYVKLVVTDSGPGIDPENYERIFEPYFTTKEPGKGTGMGLAVVHGIVQDYNGVIRLDSKLGVGTSIAVYFPLVSHKCAVRDTRPEPAPRGGERIFYIDDEVVLTRLTRKILEQLGYTVSTCNDSRRAVAIFRDDPGQFDLIISDQTLPGLTGTDMAKIFMEIRSDIPIILCTGYSNLISAEEAKELGIKEFILKPLRKDILARLIRKVLDEAKSLKCNRSRGY